MPLYALGEVSPRIHPDAYVHPDAVVIGNVGIGAGSTVWPQCVLRGDYGVIEIGERTSIQDGSVIHTTAMHPTIVGDDCVIGHLVHLECCTVHDRALVGTGSIVLHRAVIESGALVGAGRGGPQRHEGAVGCDGARHPGEAARGQRRPRRDHANRRALRRQRHALQAGAAPHRLTAPLRSGVRGTRVTRTNGVRRWSVRPRRRRCRRWRCAPRCPRARRRAARPTTRARSGRTARCVRHGTPPST